MKRAFTLGLDEGMIVEGFYDKKFGEVYFWYACSGGLVLVLEAYITAPICSLSWGLISFLAAWGLLRLAAMRDCGQVQSSMWPFVSTADISKRTPRNYGPRSTAISLEPFAASGLVELTTATVRRALLWACC